MARNEADLARDRSELEQYDIDVFVQVCDSTDKGNVERERVQQSTGPVDVLVNNAGITLVS